MGPSASQSLTDSPPRLGFPLPSLHQREMWAQKFHHPPPNSQTRGRENLLQPVGFWSKRLEHKSLITEPLGDQDRAWAGPLPPGRQCPHLPSAQLLLGQVWAGRARISDSQVRSTWPPALLVLLTTTCGVGVALEQPPERAGAVTTAALQTTISSRGCEGGVSSPGGSSSFAGHPGVQGAPSPSPAANGEAQRRGGRGVRPAGRATWPQLAPLPAEEQLAARREQRSSASGGAEGAQGSGG